MSAGGGVWHGGGPSGDLGVEGFQLWLALPPQDENGPAYSQYLAPEQVPHTGPARVIIGNYGGSASPIRPRAAINYLHVTLRDGEQWRYSCSARRHGTRMNCSPATTRCIPAKPPWSRAKPKSGASAINCAPPE
jgi:redox-sensitive bicupin YhaK (pirin superfamily)